MLPQDIEAEKQSGLSCFLQVSAELLDDGLPEAKEAARCSVVGSGVDASPSPRRLRRRGGRRTPDASAGAAVPRPRSDSAEPDRANRASPRAEPNI